MTEAAKKAPASKTADDKKPVEGKDATGVKASEAVQGGTAPVVEEQPKNSDGSFVPTPDDNGPVEGGGEDPDTTESNINDALNRIAAYVLEEYEDDAARRDFLAKLETTQYAALALDAE